ncbi:unnamed protein product [Protopolystoma xenopodis]|uniref:Uncharacterized protein n=1 Tax=Protopolystoma xenopodis TaxID=117903 RepID=A0A448XPZ9_9PLAT|nr:unnamed protein product [Protopolystoma xenopodis]
MTACPASPCDAGSSASMPVPPPTSGPRGLLHSDGLPAPHSSCLQTAGRGLFYEHPRRVPLLPSAGHDGTLGTFAPSLLLPLARVDSPRSPDSVCRSAGLPVLWSRGGHDVKSRGGRTS